LCIALTLQTFRQGPVLPYRLHCCRLDATDSQPGDAHQIHSDSGSFLAAALLAAALLAAALLAAALLAAALLAAALF
jgi:hypothetical protein